MHARTTRLRLPIWAILAAALGIGLSAPAQAQETLTCGAMLDRLAAPSPTIGFSAQLLNVAGKTVDWMKINVDGVDYAATMNGYTGSIQWDASGALNPSSHSFYATARIKWYMMGQWRTMDLDSRRLPQGAPGAQVPYGDGRSGELIIADIRLREVEFTTPYQMRTNAATLVAKPEITWDEQTCALTRNNPCGYVQGNDVTFRVDHYPLTGGGVTIGFHMRIEATPNTGDGMRLLWDSPQPVPFGIYGSLVPLYNKVAAYQRVISSLSTAVRFSSGAWMACRTYSDILGPMNGIYATLAQPAAPMEQPWVGVLNHACIWAAGATEALPATQMLTVGTYNGCTWGPSQYIRDQTNTGEVFSISGLIGTRTGCCAELADFLVCLSRALGAQPLMVQRSTTTEARGYSGFWTNQITTAPDAPPPTVTYSWKYHQWANAGTVWDGSLRFTGVTTPANMALATYETSLVSPEPAPWGDYWMPITPFLPTLG